MITAEKPKEIDFADSAEEKPIGSEMDNLLADMMEKRSKQLNQVMQNQDTNAAEKWINNEGTNKCNKISKLISDVLHTRCQADSGLCYWPGMRKGQIFQTSESKLSYIVYTCTKNSYFQLLHFLSIFCLILLNKIETCTEGKDKIPYLF